MEDKKFKETTTITLKEYIDLRYFRRNIDGKFTLKVMKRQYGVKRLQYMSTEDAVLEISEQKVNQRE